MGSYSNRDISPLELALVRKLQETGRLELVCFDVFDTILTRVFGEPAALFLTLGERLHSKRIVAVTAESFARARRLAEGAARQVAAPGKDITLREIYEELGRRYAWASGIELILETAEMEEERASIRAVPGAHRALAHARGMSASLAFVSDMYLPADFLKEQLLAHGLAEEGDKVFVSCAVGCKKGNEGALLRYVTNDLDVDPSRAIHVGNDWMVDYMAARRIGMHALYVPEANGNRYEKILNRGHWDTGGLSSLYAGASRLARLQLLSSASFEKARIQVITAVIAPLLFSYTLWVLRKASELGVRRLFFLAREGEAAYKIARSLVVQLGIPVEVYYLYVSRQSLNLALLDSPDAGELHWALTNCENDTLCESLGRLGLSPDGISRELDEIGLGEQTWNTKITPELWPRLLDTLLSDRVSAKIVAHAQARRDLVEQYLRDEGFLDDVSIGIVDTTGVGSQFRTLDRIRARLGLSKVRGFLMARMWQPRLDYSSFPGIHAYYLDQYGYQRHYSVPGLTTMLEVFCAAEHGTVTGYRSVDGRVEPVLVEAEHHASRNEYTTQIREGLEYFLQAVVTRPEVLNECVDTRGAVLETFSSFWNFPSGGDARAWGGYPVEAAKNSPNAQAVLAPSLGIRDLFNIQLKDPSGSFLGKHVWRAGAEWRSRGYIRFLITIARVTKRFGRRILQALPTRISVMLSRE